MEWAAFCERVQRVDAHGAADILAGWVAVGTIALEDVEAG